MLTFLNANPLKAFKSTLFACALLSTLMPAVHAQTLCDPTLAPQNLEATYTPGFGVLLQWDAVPASVGVQIKATAPMGSNIKKFIVGPEPTQYYVPEFILETGTYTWSIQAACSTVFPYNVTPISIQDTFSIGTPEDTLCSPVTDIDGNTYAVIEINGQCWMQENLRTYRYTNGDAIPTIFSNGSWSAATTGARASSDASIANDPIYGALYNQFAVVDPRGLCPDGWRIPSDDDWTELTSAFGGLSTAGGALKATGTLGSGTGIWQSPNTGATNASGFTAVPAGYRTNSGSYEFEDLVAIWWSNSSTIAGRAFGRRVYYDRVLVNRDQFLNNYGFSVRCLKGE
ncbi:MAG: hypothetical protein GC205_02775 [Bacteroidetes bacterium]|nr:hypothetical protein [Bacteroidota bacterium]